MKEEKNQKLETRLKYFNQSKKDKRLCNDI